MFTDGDEVAYLNDTSLGLTEGQILWHIARNLKPDVVIETGFGRGGSAAFLLAAVRPWEGRVISIDPAFRHWAGETGRKYLESLNLLNFHTLLEQPSELALADIVREGKTRLKLAYIVEGGGIVGQWSGVVLAS